MKIKALRFQATLVVCLLTFLSATGFLRAADLSADDTQFLTRYERVRAALAADDLAKAKTAATEMGEAGKAIAESDNIKTARANFATLSDHAIELAKGRSSYYVVRCPMLKKEWVQNVTQISNPYAGHEMLTCGVIVK